MFVDFFKSQYVITKSVVDPGFPRREPTPEFGVKTYYLARYLAKTSWKWKELDGEQAQILSALPSPPTPYPPIEVEPMYHDFA